MCEKATNLANVSELVICLSLVDIELNTNHELIGLEDITATGNDGNSIVRKLKDKLLRMNLKLNKCLLLRWLQYHEREK